MSFQNKGFWVVKGTGQISDREIAFDNPSKVEPKRSHEWFVDTAEVDFFPNKKQVMEDPNGKSSSGISNANFSPWENSPTFQSVPNQFIGRLFGSDARSVNFMNKNSSYAAIADPSARTKMISNHYGEDASFGLSISHSVEDSEACLAFGGIRKVKVNQVKDSDGAQALERLNFSKQNNGDIHLACNREAETRSLAMGQAFDKDGNDVSSVGRSHTYNRGDAHVISLGATYIKGDDSVISMGDSYNKQDRNIISFGGFPDEQDIIPVDRPAGDYDPLYNQPSIQVSQKTQEKEFDASNSHVAASSLLAAKLKSESVPKYVKPEIKKKEAPNSFPSNVRSLISTGMLDGVPVKYVSVGREELRGIIKGSGYLCGCQPCNYTKVLNAYEFERHAGCKTKHPNNHIYFENGKTIYQIVQELKNTPESLLFDTIQNVCGAPINQKAFRIWKESFQAATRELQRIYGREELNI